MWGGRIFSVNCSDRPSIRVYFPLTPITDPKFVLFKHVLCFARIMSSLPEFMSTNCPNWGGGPLPPPPSRTPMIVNVSVGDCAECIFYAMFQANYRFKHHLYLELSEINIVLSIEACCSY